MKALCLFSILTLISTYAISGPIYISASQEKDAITLKQKLIKFGVDSKLFTTQASDDSINIILPGALKNDLASEMKSSPKGFLILLDESAKNAKEKSEILWTKVSQHLPRSRVFAVANIQSASVKIKEILREQKRLKNGISGLGTIPAPIQNDGERYPIAPLGSAVMTSSGYLEFTGIKAIIHTASGAMTRSGVGYEPSVQSVRDSLINAAALAREAGHKRVALPAIAGSIFRGRMNNGAGIGLDVLVDEIVDVLAKEGAGMTFILTVRADNPQEGECFRKSVKKLAPAYQSRFEIADEVLWSIVKFYTHRATAIINSANMEVLFGGGVSGIVAAAADGIIPGDKFGDPERSIKNPDSLSEISYSEKIDNEAREKILIFKLPESN